MIETGSYLTVAELGEFGLIDRIRRRLGAATSSDALILGPGDDSAVVGLRAERVVASVDLLVEARHFHRDWSSGSDIGAKAAASSLADVAAMGARPLALLVGLAVPGDLPVAWVDELTNGIRAEVTRAGAAVAGGDVVSDDRVTLSMTALGDPDGIEPVTRSGARTGDLVVLAGRLGWAAAGLAALRTGRAEEAACLAMVAAHRRPEVGYEAARRLAEIGATAMLDVSDGLLADLGHVADASAVTIDLHAAAIPVDDELRAAAQVLGVDPLRLVLTGGDDHGFAATIPRADGRELARMGATVIGRVVAGPSRISVDGEELDVAVGWRHF